MLKLLMAKVGQGLLLVLAVLLPWYAVFASTWVDDRSDVMVLSLVTEYDGVISADQKLNQTPAQKVTQEIEQEESVLVESPISEQLVSEEVAIGTDSKQAVGAVPLPESIEHEQVSIDFSQIDSDDALGRFEEALWGLEDLQKQYPHKGEVYFRMGLLHEEMLDFNAARVAYEKAIEEIYIAAPLMPYSRLGTLLYQLKQYTEAKKYFEFVISMEPSNAHALYMLGMIHMAVGEFSESIAVFKQAGGADDSFQQQSLYGQGLSYIQMNAAEEAQFVLQKSVNLDAASEVGGLAKQSLAVATSLANRSYVSIFGLYGYQYDSNVVLKPSTSPNVPLITGVKDFEHTLLAVLTYAPPPSLDGSGYKASAMVYGMLHDRLNNFDMSLFNLTLTPYTSMNKSNVLSLDASFDYVLFNNKRYMDTLKLKPLLTSTLDEQLQLMLSFTASRSNYYQAVLLQSSMQDGWLLAGDVKVTAFTTDHKSSVYLGGNFTTSRTRGSDWSHHSYSALAGIDMAMPFVDNLAVGLHGSMVRQRYQNVAAGYTQKRRDSVYNADVSLSYPFGFANVSLSASYTHDISNIAVYSYMRMVTGFNISGSF